MKTSFHRRSLPGFLPSSNPSPRSLQGNEVDRVFRLPTHPPPPTEYVGPMRRRFGARVLLTAAAPSRRVAPPGFPPPVEGSGITGAGWRGSRVGEAETRRGHFTPHPGLLSSEGRADRGERIEDSGRPSRCAAIRSPRRGMLLALCLWLGPAVPPVNAAAGGNVVAWGSNSSGQTNVPVAAQSGVTAIAAGGAHTVALKTNGTVVAWGQNFDGQTTVPAGLSGVTAIAGGSVHTVALKSDGTVVAWGDSGFGRTTVPAGLSGAGRF